jgi:hypothetical protein
MLKKSILAFALGTASISIIAPALAAERAKAAVDPAQMKLAEDVVLKLVPPGTYQKMMRDMASGDFMQQIMGMDASMLAGIAGENAEEAAALSGKSLIDLAGEKDPHFKERMDITMKVMFEEMGTMFNTIEPDVRSALAQVYARKYSIKQLTDMKSFFATESGNSFAANFMSNFMDKEIMTASMKAVPVLIEGMPAIMKKVEAATAHLPALPGKEADGAQTAAGPASDNGTEPWYSRENWAAADQKKIAQLETATDKANGAYLDFEMAAVERSRESYKKKGWNPDPKENDAAPTDGVDRVEGLPAAKPQ